MTPLLAGLALIAAPAVALGALRLWDWWRGAWRDYP